MNRRGQEQILQAGDQAIMTDTRLRAPLPPAFKMTLMLGPVGTILIAIMGLLGYIPGLRVLGSIRSDYIPMAPSTAASFLVLGTALLHLSRKRQAGSAAKALIAPVILVMLFSLLNVAGNIAGMDLNFEARLTSGAGTIKGIPVSRMSPLTGAAFVLAGLATLLLLLGRRNSHISRRIGHCASSLGVMSVLGGSTVLLAYIYGSPLMYSGVSVPMAATTAIAFVLLGAAVAAAAGPESFPLRLISGGSTSARLSRVFFPLTVAVVLLQGFLSHLVSASAVMPNALFLAFLAIVAGTISVTVIIRIAHSIGGSLDKASEKLLEREARLSKTQEMAHVGSWELDIATGRLIWSDEVYRIFGLQPQEFPATYEAFLDSIHPQDRAAVDSAYTNSIQDGADSYEIDHRVVRKHSGEVRFVHERCEHLRDVSGRIVRSVGMVHDITNRHNVEEALKKSENEFHSLAESMPQIVWITRPDGWNIYFNQQWVAYTGLTLEESYGHGWNKPFHPDDQQRAWDAWQNAITNNSTYSLECRLRRFDGIYKWWLIRGVPLLDEHGAIMKWFGTCTDIEEIKRQLAEKEVLLKEVHHRIKNNIASIGGLLSLRLQSIRNPEAIAALQDAIGRVDSMRILYDKLLLSKGYENISVKNYIESLADSTVALFPGSAKIIIEKSIADLHLDPKRLFPIGLIINELLTNKMKYAFAGRDSGRIRISLTQDGHRVRLVLQDDGVGLPDGFELEKSKGFGLMLVKMLSQQLGGSFSIETHEGTRSILEFDL